MSLAILLICLIASNYAQYAGQMPTNYMSGGYGSSGYGSPGYGTSSYGIQPITTTSFANGQAVGTNAIRMLKQLVIGLNATVIVLFGYLRLSDCD